MFDYLLLLNAGETIYFGPARDALSYFSRLGYICPDFVNPADFLLDMLDDEIQLEDPNNEENQLDEQENDAPKIDTRVVIKKENAVSQKDFGTKFLESEENLVMMDRLTNIQNKPGAEISQQKVSRDYPISIWQQFIVLLARSWVAASRDKTIVFVRTGAGLGIGILVGAIFFGQKNESSSFSARMNSTLFMMCVFSLFCLSAMGKYIKERIHFVRERASGYYSAGPYFFASQAVEVPLLSIIVILYSNITYWMIGLEPRAENFFYLVATVFVVVNGGFSMAQLISSCVSTMTMALACYFIFLVWCLLLGGFIVHVDMMPGPIQWLIYTSYFFYGFQGLILNEFEHKEYGHGVILGLDFTGGNKWIDLGVLFAFWFSLMTLTFLSLKFLNKETR